MGVFRIARAEFIKIFKKPSVYIMGVILASVLVLSLLFFDPVGKQDYSVNLSGPTVGQVYDKFTNDDNTLGGDFKKSKFDEAINKNESKLNFYLILNNRSSKLQNLNSEFASLFTDLSNAIKKPNNTVEINNIYEDVKKKINEYLNDYNDIKSLTDFSEFYKLYTESDAFKNPQTILTNILSLSEKEASTFVNAINVNKYFDELNKISDNNNNFINLSINVLVKSLETKFKDYYNLVINNPAPSYASQYLIKRDALLLEVKNCQTYIKSLVDSNYTLAFVEKKDYDNLITLFTATISTLESFEKTASSDKSVNERHQDIVKTLEASKFYDKISDFNNKIVKFNVSNKTIESLQKTISNKVAELKDGLTKSINSANAEAASTDKNKLANINDLITSYRVLSINTTSLVDNTLLLEATSQFNSANINTYYGLEKFIKYEANEEIKRVSYFINNGEYNQNFADVFSFNKNSGTKTSAYDFMFFAMKIATLIISAFAILMAASLIASEYDSGTIKLLAMRPFKRWKILTGKLFATMFFVLVFILFSFLISFVAGICMYPILNTPVLAVLNGQVAFSIHPILLMLINLFSIILEVFFYAVLALSISTLFRSYTAAISISFVTFILGFSLNILFGGVFWYSFIPFINTDFFRFFGGSFLGTQTGAINEIFTTSLLSNSNIFISLGIYLGTIAILVTLTYFVFKKRDF